MRKRWAYCCTMCGTQVISMGAPWYSLSQSLLQMDRSSNPNLRNAWCPENQGAQAWGFGSWHQVNHQGWKWCNLSVKEIWNISWWNTMNINCRPETAVEAKITVHSIKFSLLNVPSGKEAHWNSKETASQMYTEDYIWVVQGMGCSR